MRKIIANAQFVMPWYLLMLLPILTTVILGGMLSGSQSISIVKNDVPCQVTDFLSSSNRTVQLKMSCLMNDKPIALKTEDSALIVQLLKKNSKLMQCNITASDDPTDCRVKD